MSKGTSIREALSKWEEEKCQKACESKEVKLLAQIPPIEKMDASLSTLTCCEKLSLSSNQIEKIQNLNGLKSLKILSIGRNNIKNLNGLDVVSDTLEELWISYNSLEKLKGIQLLRKLKILYMSNNAVKDVAEFKKLSELPLVELVFTGNPLQEAKEAKEEYLSFVTTTLPHLKKLDGIPIVRNEEEEEED